MVRHYNGSCHCGAVRFEFEAEPIQGAMRCDCSICRRKSGFLSIFTLTNAALRIDAANDALSTYQFGTGVARHHFCCVCGVHPFTETRLRPGEFRINLGCVEDIELNKLDIEEFDGQSI